MNYKIYKYLDNLNIKYANGNIKEFSKLLRQYYGKQKTSAHCKPVLGPCKNV